MNQQNNPSFPPVPLPVPGPRLPPAMTEQEAATLVARLTRVWGSSFVVHNQGRGEYLFESEIQPSISLRCGYQINLGPYGGLSFGLANWRYAPRDLRLIARANGEIFSEVCDWPFEPPFGLTISDLERELKPFAAQWLPFFLRNCWLSGCPIDASAHEKMEWIQGFTREEIEAWNLKM
ncbi:hypothetical protein IAD21_00256 [Abditibacteriota bacterium]|nr:hypothetical protein IAD21_00256 [Abditibacteriota bacterium]